MQRMTHVNRDGSISEYRYGPDSGSVWHTHDPGHKCALFCGRDGEVQQIRATGPNRKPQTWWFCRECWERYYGAGQDTRPKVIERESRINFDLIGSRQKCL